MGKRWSESDIWYLKIAYPSVDTIVISHVLNRPVGAINRRANILGIKKTDTYIKTKVRVISEKCKESRRHVIGEISQGKNGYFYIKTGIGIVLLHHEVWKNEHGSYPHYASVITFIDGDRSNCSIENLKLVSRAEFMLQNSVHNLPEEIKHFINLKRTLTFTITQRNKNGKPE